MDAWVPLAAINLIASLWTLYLIFKMKKYNGYINMIVSMTLAQGVYDASLFMFKLSSKGWQSTQLFLGIFCGTAAAVWSLVICVVMTYIIASRKYFDIEKNFRKIFFGVTAFSSIDAISCLITYLHGDTSTLSLFRSDLLVSFAFLNRYVAVISVRRGSLLIDINRTLFCFPSHSLTILLCLLSSDRNF